jgi:hypothetical protein
MSSAEFISFDTRRTENVSLGVINLVVVIGKELGSLLKQTVWCDMVLGTRCERVEQGHG